MPLIAAAARKTVPASQVVFGCLWRGLLGACNVLGTLLQRALALGRNEIVYNAVIGVRKSAG